MIIYLKVQLMSLFYSMLNVILNYGATIVIVDEFSEIHSIAFVTLFMNKRRKELES